MKQLNANWITEGHLDFEYKKYVLLAYLQEVENHFNESKLYPVLSDLVFHYNNLISIKQNKTLTAEQFPKKLTRLDLKEFTTKYEKLIHDDEYLEVIESIIDYALPKTQKYLEEGKELYEFVEDKLNIFPVGVIPINASEGYLFIRAKEKRETKVFEYGVSLFENAQEKFRSLKTAYLTTYSTSLTNTYEQIKIDLIKTVKKLPNPAIYVIESELQFPFQESLFPVAKRKIVRILAQHGA